MSTDHQDPPSPVTANPWQQLRLFTSARIALGRVGTSMPTEAQLAFSLAHARARSAVHREVDFPALADSLAALGPVLRLYSAAPDRPTYLQRPDLGRRLDEPSQAILQAQAQAQEQAQGKPRVAIVVADGLSSLAVERNVMPFLDLLLPAIAPDWRLAPFTLVQNARVAVGDEIGAALGASLVVVLIGERPGLSSPDSMGIYMTWQPRVGMTDESRNCISNVRAEGLSYPVAMHKLRYLMAQSHRRGLSGVHLKDELDAVIASQSAVGPAHPFLAAPAAKP